MDWNAAIEKNRDALKHVLATLVGMAALAGGGATLPRHLHRAVLRLLRPAEAAARRLIIVAARGLVAALPPSRPRQPAIRRQPGRAGTPPQTRRVPALPLVDPLPRWNSRARPVAGSVPRISVPGFSEPFRIAVRHPDDPVDAARLASRLAALAAALDDLPGQAKRFARRRARSADAPAGPQRPSPACGEGAGAGVAGGRTSRHVSHAAGRARRLWPLRPGHPPGWRRKPVHEVHAVLNVVHGLAFWALEAPDTS